MMVNNNQSSVRRFDIDWKSNFVYLLIPYHVAVGLIWGVYGDEFNGISMILLHTMITLVVSHLFYCGCILGVYLHFSS